MKKKCLKVGLAVLLTSVYIARVVYINCDNTSFDIVYYADSQKVEHDGVEYSVKAQKLYEVAAYAETYPDAEMECSPMGNSYVQAGMPEAYESMKYILEISLSLTNLSTKKREIEITGYQLNGKNQTIFQSVALELTALRNDAIVQQFAPGETKEIVLVYQLLEIVNRNLTYRRLKNEPLAVIVSGYPNPKQLTLNHLELVKTKGDALKQKQANNEAPSMQKENTPAGTVMPIGEEIISQGIGTSVTDVQIVKNVNEYEDYHPDSWRGHFRKNNLHPDGTVDTYFEEEYLDTLPYEIEKNYAVSVSKIDVIQLANKDYAYSSAV